VFINHLKKLSSFFFRSSTVNIPPQQPSPQNPVVSVQLPYSQPIPIRENQPIQNQPHPYFPFLSSPKNSPTSSPKQGMVPIPPPMAKFPICFSSFDISDEAAKKKFFEWTSTLWFAPSSFSANVKIIEFTRKFYSIF
jgi:hypothetical protein